MHAAVYRVRFIRAQCKRTVQQAIRLVSPPEQHEHAGGVVARIRVVGINGEMSLEGLPRTAQGALFARPILRRLVFLQRQCDRAIVIGLDSNASS